MNGKIKKIIITLLIVEIIIVAAFGVIVYSLQSKIITELKQDELMFAAELFDDRLDERNEKLELLEDEYDEMLLSKAKQAAYYIDHLKDAEADESVLRALASVIEAEEVHIISENGEVLISSDDPVIEITPEHIHAAGGDLTEYIGDRSYRSYAAPLKNGNYVLLCTDEYELEQTINGFSSDTLFLSTYLGFNGAMIIFDADGTVLYSQSFDQVYEGDNIFEKGISKAKLTEGSLKEIRVSGNYHHIIFKWIEDAQTWVALSIPQSMINKQLTATVALLVFCFFCILSIFNIYIVFLYIQSLKDINRDISHAAQNKEKMEINALLKDNAKKIEKKIIVVVVIGTFIAFLMTVYLQNMSMISIYSAANTENMEDIDFRLSWNQSQKNNIENTMKKLLINKAVTAAYIIGEEPDVRNIEDLEELNSALDTEYVVIFDKNGKEVTSNGRFVGITVSENSDDPSYQLRSLMYGNPYVYTQPVAGEFSGEIHQDVGAVIRTDGLANGFVVVSHYCESLDSIYALTDPLSTYKSINLTETKPLVINPETGVIVFADGAKCEGKDARNYGITDSKLRDNFNGFLTFCESRYYASSMQLEDGNLLFLITPNQIIAEGNLAFALIICALILISLVIFTLINRLMVGKDLKKLLKGSIHVTKNGDNEDEDYTYVDVVMPDGSVKRAISVLGRFSLRNVDWEQLSPEQKVAALIRIFITIFACVAVLVLIFKSSIFTEEGSILRYILSMEWERNINLFSLTFCAIIICVIFMAEFIIDKLLSNLVKIASPKGETMIRMLKNLLKYISVIVGAFLCLSYIGVKVTTLLAGAGLLTVVIGLGAQSLISDVLSGLFIIFEGDFQVGDIVTINNFRGTVQEIGIRTSKIINAGGDLNIIRNSALNDILNMTRQNSRCNCELLIEYGADLNKTIETIISEFDVIRANVPEIVEGPTFAGVKELSDNGVKLLVIAFCSEKDRFACTFGINRELKLICERNNINIPFPQVVVHEDNK